MSAPRRAKPADEPAALDPVTGPEVQAAEQRLAACCLCGRAAEVLESVLPEHFFSHPLRRVLTLSAKIIARGAAVDFVSLVEGQDDVQVFGPFLLHLTEIFTGSANIPAWSRVVEKDWRRRNKIRISRALGNGAASDPELADSLIREYVALDEASERHARMTDAALSGAQLMTADLPPVVPLMGQGLIISGGLTVIIGPSGLGKTFLALQIMKALAEGSLFLGQYWTPEAGTRCGMLQLEMPADSIRDRARSIGGKWLENVDFLCNPEFDVDITTRDTQNELIHWCRARELRMLFVDPLSFTHSLDENKAQDMAAILSGWRRVRVKAGVAVGILHHVIKAPQELKAIEATPKTVVLHLARGSGRLGNDPDTVIGLLEAPGGRRRLIWAKTRHCETPPDPYLTRDEHGYFVTGEAIQSVRSHSTDAKIEKYLLASGPRTAKEIATAVNMSYQGVRKALDRMLENPSSIQFTLRALDFRPIRYEIVTQDDLETTTQSEPIEPMDQFNFVSDDVPPDYE